MVEIKHTTHMQDSLKPTRAVCNQPEMIHHSLERNIDLVDCVLCLRMLAKDAAIYGVDRRAKKR